MLKKQNSFFQRTSKHKSSFSSLHQEARCDKKEGKSVQMRNTLGKSEWKGRKGSRLVNQESCSSYNSTLGTTFGSFVDLKKTNIKKFNQEITRYTRKELECYFESMLKFSNGDPIRYKQGLETMLNLMNVPTN